MGEYFVIAEHCTLITKQVEKIWRLQSFKNSQTLRLDRLYTI